MTRGHIRIESQVGDKGTAGEPYNLYTYHDGHIDDLLRDMVGLPQFLADIEFAPHLYRLENLRGVEEFYDDPVYKALEDAGGSGGVWCMVIADTEAAVERYLDLDTLVNNYLSFGFYEWGTRGVAEAITRRRPFRWFPTRQEECDCSVSVLFEIKHVSSGARFDTCLRPVKSRLIEYLGDPEDEYTLETLAIWNNSIAEGALPHYAAEDDGFHWLRLEAGHITAIHGKLQDMKTILDNP